MSGLTLVEAAKRVSDPIVAGVIEMFAQGSDILRTLPFTGIAGNAIRFNREQKLPGVGFRGVNEGFTESTGILNPVTETLAIVGGDLDVDKFIVKTMGESQRTAHERMQIKALAGRFTRAFFKGDPGLDPREFDGLQKRIGGNQLVDAGATSGGDALSLEKLDELIDACDSPSALAMNKALRRRLTAAARDTAVGGFISYEKDEFGRKVTHYNDLPILIVDEDNEANQILPFTEANPGLGTPASTSIYCMSYGPTMLSGIENGGIDARDLGELETKPSFRTRTEWYAGLAVWHGRAAARLRGIKNAAVVK